VSPEAGLGASDATIVAADAVAAPGVPVRFPCFDGLRAIAALTVVVYHTVSEFRPSWYEGAPADWISRLGSFGVCVFFLISGFLLYRPFVLAHFESRPVPDLLPFWKRRFFRIFPAYWVAVAALFFVFELQNINTWQDALTAFGLLQNYRAGYEFYGIGVAWTLVVEVSFYLALPLIAMALRALAGKTATVSHKLHTQLIGLAVLYAVGLISRAWAPDLINASPASRGDWLAPSRVNWWLNGFLDWFALGMLLAVMSAWAARGGRLPKIVHTLGAHPWVCWLLALESYWVMVQLNMPIDIYLETETIQTLGLTVFCGLVAFFLIFPAVFGSQDRKGLRGLLRSKVMVFLGTISYGMYLWHIIYVKQVNHWSNDGELPHNLYVWFVVVLGLTLATATISYYVVERPIIRLSHKGRPPRTQPVIEGP
jgi:peptidoglycan/LPS O-acetylase OafA/YrhL